MISVVANRGHSFKGAAQYYLHDKNAQTNERVDWTHTHNLPTNDARKGLGWMAYTAMNADELKHQSGAAKTGRKRKAGVVYSFSLSWHPKQEPTKQTMLDAALDTLNRLKLHEQEAVIVAHNDEPHPHLHVICNLVHPETGKVAVPSYDRLTLSTWAENLEREDGEILCEQRVINNAKRRQEAKKDREFALIKHREEKVQNAWKIHELYLHCDGAKAFQAALNDIGYTLAKGDRRGLVLVDEQGKISSLSRQLRGQKSKDIRERLKGLENLPQAEAISQDRKNGFNPTQSFDRDKYETERQKRIVDAAIKQSKQKEFKSLEEPSKTVQYNYDESHLRKLDTLRDWEQKTQRLRYRLNERLEAQYGKSRLLKEIKTLEKQLISPPTVWTVIPGKLETKKEELENLKKNLDNVNWRIGEQKQALEAKINETRPDFDKQDSKNYNHTYRVQPYIGYSPQYDRER